MDDLLVKVFARQHGVASIAQFLEAGVSRRILDGLVARGDLVRVHQGVYRHAAAPVTDEQRIRAGLLAVGPRGVLSHRSSVVRYGMWNVRSSIVEVTHCAFGLPLRDGLVVHRSRCLSADDIRLVGGVPTTSPARTLIDCGLVVPEAIIARWSQEWLAKKVVTMPDISKAITRAGNHRGVGRLRRALSAVVPEADSPAEARLGVILAKAGLAPAVHVVVTVDNGLVYELDWAYPDHMVALEVDGYGVHLLSERRFTDDRHRRNELEIAGWQVMNFTPKMLRRPAWVVDQVRRMLAASRFST